MWRQGKDGEVFDGGTELLHIYAKKSGPFKHPSGKGGQGWWCRGYWAVKRFTVIGHGEDRNLSDGSSSALHTACPLIDGGQVCVHVSWETSAPGHLLSGR